MYKDGKPSCFTCAANAPQDYGANAEKYARLLDDEYARLRAAAIRLSRVAKVYMNGTRHDRDEMEDAVRHFDKFVEENHL